MQCTHSAHGPAVQSRALHVLHACGLRGDPRAPAPCSRTAASADGMRRPKVCCGSLGTVRPRRINCVRNVVAIQRSGRGRTRCPSPWPRHFVVREWSRCGLPSQASTFVVRDSGKQRGGVRTKPATTLHFLWLPGWSAGANRPRRPPWQACVASAAALQSCVRGGGLVAVVVAAMDQRGPSYFQAGLWPDGSAQGLRRTFGSEAHRG